jgi:hypothetical protein
MTSFRVSDHVGDLFAMSGLDYFVDRENALGEKPSAPLENDTNLEDARVIALSDSFGNVLVGEGNFSMRLQNSLNLPVADQKDYDQINGLDVRFLHPLQWAETRASRCRKAKVLVWLRVVRVIFGKSLNCESLFAPPKKISAPDELERIGPPSGIHDILFDNSKLEYVVRNGFLTRWAFEMVANGRFFCFRKTSNLVTYGLEPRMLFYELHVRTFNSPIKNRGMDQLVCFFEKLKEELMERYGITLVFVPIPTKYMIYHDYADPASTYNDFLPLLIQELEAKGVICVNLYPVFMEQRGEILYWADDTHWNDRGMDVAVEATISELQKHQLFDAFPPDS